MIFVPATKSPRGGRQAGGSIMLIRADIKHQVLLKSAHCILISIHLAGREQLIGGVYLQSACNTPTDTVGRFSEQLDSISAHLEDANGRGVDFMLMGDCNAGPNSNYVCESSVYKERTSNFRANSNSSLFTEFVNRLNIQILDLEQGSGPTYTFTGPKPYFNRSYIDHVLISVGFLQEPARLISCQVLCENLDNMSDHLPISLSTSVDYVPSLPSAPIDCDLEPQKRSFFKFHRNEAGCALYNASMAMQAEQDGGLETFLLMSSSEQMTYITDLMMTNAETAENSLSRNAFINHYFTAKHWWTPRLDELRGIVIAYFAQLPIGTDLRGVPAGSYRLAKRAYKNEIRRVKKKLSVRHFTNLDRAKSAKPRQFWKKVGQKRCKTSKLNINNKTTPKDINDELCRTFRDRLNDNSLLGPGHTTIAEEVRAYAQEGLAEDYSVYFDDALITTSIKLLHANRACDSRGLTAELFKVCTVPAVIKMIVALFNSIAAGGPIPFEMSHSVIVPLIKKPQKGTVDPNNYRGISLVSVFSKIFELALLEKFPSFSKTSALQHGFKKQESCAHAAYTVRETIKLYTKNSTSTVFMCSLDAEKAFDRVWWDGLFYKLKPLIPHKIWLLLYKYYGASTFQVTYEGKLGGIESMSCGVKQGGILSPFLFTFFINDLLMQLEASELGTRVDCIFTGAVAYADDIILLSKTSIGLQQMIDLSCLYCRTWKIKLNAGKTEIICFNRIFSRNKMTFLLDGNVINLSKRCMHLGLEWNSEDKYLLSSHLAKKVTSLSISTSSLINKGLQSCHPDSIAFLVKNQLLPLLYGIEFCVLNKTRIMKYSQQIRCLFKRSFRCSKHCSNVLLTVFDLPTFLEIMTKRALITKRCILNNDYTKGINSYINATFGSDMFSELATDFPLPEATPTPETVELACNLRNLVSQWSEPEARKSFYEQLHQFIPDVVQIPRVL
jgi:hypothetical protein